MEMIKLLFYNDKEELFLLYVMVYGIRKNKLSMAHKNYLQNPNKNVCEGAHFYVRNMRIT